MTDIKHGGKREGSGRPKGSTTISPALRDSFREHTETALNAIVAIAGNAEHPNHLKACELILSRGYGLVTAPSEAELFVDRFISGEITAIQAGLLIESRGLKVGQLLDKYIKQEFMVHHNNKEFLAPAERLPTK